MLYLIISLRNDSITKKRKKFPLTAKALRWLINEHRLCPLATVFCRHAMCIPYSLCPLVLLHLISARLYIHHASINDHGSEQNEIDIILLHPVYYLHVTYMYVNDSVL